MARRICLHGMQRRRTEDGLDIGRNRRGGPINDMSCSKVWSVAKEALEEVAMMVPMPAIAASRTMKVPTVVPAPRTTTWAFWYSKVGSVPGRETPGQMNGAEKEPQ